MLQQGPMTHVVKDLREERDLTQRQLAEKAGISAGTVYKVEAGLVQPFGRTLYKLARALGVPVAVLRACGPAGTPQQDKLPGLSLEAGGAAREP